MRCEVCNKRAYSNRCVAHKPRKPIRKKGKHTIEYEEWRDNVARPYLDKTYGHKCAYCGTTKRLDVQHIKKRGSHPHLKMELSNIEYLCRSCHIRAT